MDRFTAAYYIVQAIGVTISAVAHLVEVIKGKGHDTSTIEPPLAALQAAHADLSSAIGAAAGLPASTVRT